MKIALFRYLISFIIILWMGSGVSVAQDRDSSDVSPDEQEINVDSTESKNDHKIPVIKVSDSPLENLGKNINTEYDESAPVITPDGKRLYFWSKRPDGYGFMDIYSAFIDDTTGNFLPSKNLGNPINDGGANIVLSITPDGQKLLVYKEISAKLKADGFSDLAIARKGYGGWQNPVSFKIEGFDNTGGASLTAYLGADNKTLVLSYTGTETKGSDDLYVSFLNPSTKKWTHPRNLGGIINTAGSEITPFIASDGLTLYFSSDKPGGLGGFDIYMTQRLDSTWKNWSPPKNLGPKVNSKGDDLHFKFPASAEFGYLVSTYPADTNYGGKDIYTCLIPNEFKPKPVTLVKGIVLDLETKSPIESKISYIALPSGEEMGTANSDSKTGEYTIILPSGYNFSVLAESEKYISISEHLNTKGEKAYNEIQKDLYLAPIKVNEVIRMNSLFFATGSSNIQIDSYPELERLVKLLQKHPNMKIEVSGHTDNIGPEGVNQSLSTARAEAALKYVISKGILSERVSAKGYGSQKPYAPNDDEIGRQLNRRVEFKVLSI